VLLVAAALSLAAGAPAAEPSGTPAVRLAEIDDLIETAKDLGGAKRCRCSTTRP